MSSRRPFPADYVVCETCGYDHAHDLPHLSARDRSEAMRLHDAPSDARGSFLSAALTAEDLEL